MVQSTMDGKSSQQELDVPGHISFTVWKKRAINAFVLSSFSPFHTVLDLSLGSVSPKVSGHAPRPSSPVNLDLIRLMPDSITVSHFQLHHWASVIKKQGP